MIIKRVSEMDVVTAAKIRVKNIFANGVPGHFSIIRQYEKALNVPAEHLFPDIFNS